MRILKRISKVATSAVSGVSAVYKLANSISKGGVVIHLGDDHNVVVCPLADTEKCQPDTCTFI